MTAIAKSGWAIWEVKAISHWFFGFFPLENRCTRASWIPWCSQTSPFCSLVTSSQHFLLRTKMTWVFDAVYLLSFRNQSRRSPPHHPPPGCILSHMTCCLLCSPGGRASSCSAAWVPSACTLKIRWEWISSSLYSSRSCRLVGAGPHLDESPMSQSLPAILGRRCNWCWCSSRDWWAPLWPLHLRHQGGWCTLRQYLGRQESRNLGDRTVRLSSKSYTFWSSFSSL